MAFPRLRRFTGIIALSLFVFLVGWRLGMLYQSGGIAAVGFLSQGDRPVAGDPEKQADLSLLWQTWRLLQEHYIAPDDLKAQTMIEGATAGLVRAVGDPFTLFMSKKENTDFRQMLEGKLQGIGAEMSDQDGSIVIVAPLKGSPAEKAGLKPGDIVDAVDGKSIDGLALNDVVALIRGPKGTTVKLHVIRGAAAQPLSFTIRRDDISVPTVESRLITKDGKTIGYVALNQFGENSVSEMAKALKDFQGKTLAGIVFDLRGDGGGYLDGAVDVTSMFLKEGNIVTVEQRDRPPEEHHATGEALFPDTPLVVLIDQGSASASEITAGALQDAKRATIVGMKSYGKGTVQEVIDLPGGDSLRVTIARWFTPKGRNLGKEGVQPDIVVDRAPGDVAQKKDTQLDAAVQWLLYKKVPTKSASSSTASAQ